MQVVSKGREDCIRVWKGPLQMDIPHRMMRYLIAADTEKGRLLLNTVTGELILLDADERGFLEKLPALPLHEYEDLVTHRFLVPVGFDELKSVNQLRNVLQKHATSEAITGYTILPTSACNARCFYCYESNMPHYSMTEETARKVVEYVEAHCGKEKKVSIHWFGGEPTLGEVRIDEICDGLARKGISYDSTMISNGYLFSPEMARKAKEKWHLRSVQITLDGTQEIYNTTKSYVNATSNPYVRVLDNISLLLDQEIRVTVRMNLGFHNAEDLGALIKELTGRFAARKRFRAYVHELFEDQGFNPTSHTDEERIQLKKIADTLNASIRKMGCRQAEDDGKLPALKAFYCMADNPMSLLVNPLGQLGKCEHGLYSCMVGDVDKGHDFSQPNARYWLKPKYVKSCEGCELYPFCGQIESCETRSECFSEMIRGNIIDSIRTKMRKTFEGGRIDEQTRG